MTQGKPSYELFMLRGPAPGTVYALANKSLTIGRDPLSDITVSDPEVSRQHALIISNSAGDYRIQDLGSTNGTFIDGARVGSKPEKLLPSNAIAMGSAVTFIFREISDVATADQEMEDAGVSPSEEVPDKVRTKNDAPVSGLQEQESQKRDLPVGEPVKEKDSKPREAYVAEKRAAVTPRTPGDARQPQQIETNQATDLSPRLILGLVLLLLCCCATVMIFLMVLRGDWFLRQAGLVP